MSTAGDRFERIAIRRLFSVVNGATPDSQNPEYWDGDVAWVTPEDLSNRASVRIRDSKRTITEAGYSSCGTTLVPTGSIVLSTRAPIGNLAIADRPLCTNQGCRSLVPLTRLSSRFFFYQLGAMTAELNKLGRGTTFLELSSNELAAVKVSAPSTSVQERIANFLDERTARIDALIAEKEMLLERLAEYARSHADDLFRLRVDQRGAVRLKYRCPDVTVGIVVTPAKYYVESGVPCLRSLNVVAGHIVEENLVYISAEANELHSKSKIYAGDVVVVRSGKPGSTAVVTEAFHGANCIDLVIIRASKTVNPDWLCAYINSAPALEQVSDASEGAIQQHFNVSSARELRIPDSPLGEQAEDLEMLRRTADATGSLSMHASEHIDRLREYRSSLISTAVTGQLDIGALQKAA